MHVKKKKAPGPAVRFQENGLSKGLTTSDYTLLCSSLQEPRTTEKNSTSVEKLMSKAEQLMKLDPQRAGDHFLIWLSLHCLKTGRSWRGRR